MKKEIHLACTNEKSYKLTYFSISKLLLEYLCKMAHLVLSQSKPILKCKKIWIFAFPVKGRTISTLQVIAKIKRLNFGIVRLLIKFSTRI